MENYLPLLEKTALFEGIERRDIEKLCDSFHCHTAFYPRASVLIRRSERVRSAGVVLRGCVQAERNGADGSLRIVARHTAGGLFGDVLSVSSSGESPVDVVAAEDTQVLFVPLEAIMREDPPGCSAALIRLRMNFLRELSDRFWALSRQVEILRAPTLRAKLARRLLEERSLCRRDSFTLSGTRETLASELGVNRSALSRELGKLRREGVLDMNRGEFTLLDVPALEGIALQ